MAAAQADLLQLGEHADCNRLHHDEGLALAEVNGSGLTK
jgi:hypothetical protein